MIADVFSVAVTIVLYVLGLTAFLFAVRVPARFLVREIRRVIAGTGKMSWYQIIPESRRSNQSESSPEAQVARVTSFIKILTERFPFWYRRPTVTFAWQSNDQDGLWSLYIGVDRVRDGRTTAAVEALAKGLNCRAEAIEHRPDFDHQDVTVAYVTDENQIMAKDVPSELGMVATNLSSSRELDGTFMVTMEFMRQEERRILAKNLAVDLQSELGDSANYASSTAQNAQIIKTTASRTVMTASSRTGDPGISENIITTAVGAMSNLAFQVDAQTPGRNHSEKLLYWALGLTPISVVAFWFDLININTLIVSGILPVIMLGLSASTGLLHSMWYQIGMKRGEVAIPPFSLFSPKRIFRNLVYRRLGYNFIGVNTITVPEVVSLYNSPLTQMLSITSSARALDVQSEPVPMEGFSSQYEGVDNDDVFLGVSGTGQIATIGIDDIQYPLYISGGAGSGKSNTMMVIFSGLARIARRNSRGYQITPIWSETKGEGAEEAREMVKDDPNAIFVEAHNPNCEYRFAMEGRRLSEGASVKEITANAASLVSAMQNAWGESIKDASLEALSFSLQASLLMDGDDIRSLDLDRVVNPDRPNVIKLMYLILGGDINHDPSDALIQLSNDLDDQLDREERLQEDGKEPELSDEEFERIDALYGALTVIRPYVDRADTRYRELQQRKVAPMNKLSQIVAAESLWTPDHRTDVYVGQIVGNFAPVVINFGKFYDPDLLDHVSGELGGYDGSVSEGLARRLSLMYSYLMWNYINSRCAGWEDRGRRVILMYDEVADVATDSDDAYNVISEITKRGRSRGCAVYAASQYPSQLPSQARDAVLGFRTKIWYQLRRRDDAIIALQELGSNTPYTEDNIKNLPMQTGIGIAEIKKGPDVTSAFTLMSPEAHLWSRVSRVSQDLGEAVSRYQGETDEPPALEAPR